MTKLKLNNVKKTHVLLNNIWWMFYSKLLIKKFEDYNYRVD